MNEVRTQRISSSDADTDPRICGSTVLAMVPSIDVISVVNTTPSVISARPPGSGSLP